LNNLLNSLAAAWDHVSWCLGSFKRSLYSIDLPVSSSITAHARHLNSCRSGMNASAFPPWLSSIATALPYPFENFDRIGILSSVVQYWACVLSKMVSDSACFHAVWLGFSSSWLIFSSVPSSMSPSWYLILQKPFFESNSFVFEDFVDCRIQLKFLSLWDHSFPLMSSSRAVFLTILFTRGDIVDSIDIIIIIDIVAVVN
jgi:hypothetical protein